MRHTIHRFYRELEFGGTFADSFLGGRGIIAAESAGQAAVIGTVRGGCGALWATEFDRFLVRFVFGAGHENGNAIHC